MRYFANPSTPPVRDAMSAGLLDCIVTPRQRLTIPEGSWICADSGLFGKGYPGDDKWWEWVQSLPVDRCRFVTAPDVVGDAEATLERSRPWLAKIRATGRPVAFVAQNGIDRTVIPWGEFDVLFIGGAAECSPCGYVRPINAPRVPRGQQATCPSCRQVLAEWKLSAAVQRLVVEAKRLGKWVHMGRVNSGARLDYAAAVGCDSADGTYIRFGPDVNLPKVLRWLHRVNSAATLFDLA